MDAILVDDILKWNFLKENYRIPIRISLKLFPVDNKPALVIYLHGTITWLLLLRLFLTEKLGKF